MAHYHPFLSFNSADIGVPGAELGTMRHQNTAAGSSAGRQKDTDFFKKI